MRLAANLETIDRLVEQGALILRSFHAQNGNNRSGAETEFLRGEFTGWRNTIHTEYHDCAEEIVDVYSPKHPCPSQNASIHFIFFAVLHTNGGDLKSSRRTIRSEYTHKSD